MLMVTTCRKPHMQISHDLRLHDPDPGPQEKSTEKRVYQGGNSFRQSKGRTLLAHRLTGPLLRGPVGVQMGNCHTL